jgi:hypothetical protein
MPTPSKYVLPYNMYKRYKISKNLTGVTINYVARAGKSKKKVGVANTEAELIKQMAELAKKKDNQFIAKMQAEEAAAAAAEAESTSGKKVPLWKSGGLVSKVTDAATNIVNKPKTSSSKSKSTSQPNITKESIG